MTTALYRRYRPDTFADMIGQEHVTGPLMQALRSGRVNHAYLFSGPRGCGKTTSARILARTLNCHRNTPDSPLDTPCGECESCVELARGGSGSLDVVEIDAASHNGVDDARDLRERATFAPARDRYKIFILDEAHMVTPQGFNALLKIVEEPPPHIKFVFATTEPDKVIGTIRSRTHHYPFRLVPPDVLSPYLEKLSDAEGIKVGSGVLPLVTRAGGGSVRDSLSVMDQLIAGASGGEVGYDLAVGLLGYTHSSLLDDVVDALAARDGASIFRVVDQIIATGHEPRRFVEDVLERLRDLIVIGVSGDAADAVLRDLPADQLERMRAQAGRLGVAELSRAADLVNAALTEMTGATSPRLHLELLCARLLLPGADDGSAGLAARIDRLERGGIAVQAGGGNTTQTAASTGTEPVPAGDVGGGLTGAAAARAVVEANRARKGAPAGGTAAGGSSSGGSASGGSAPGSPAIGAPAGPPESDESAATDPQEMASAQATPGARAEEAVAPRSQNAVEQDQPVRVPDPAQPSEASAEQGRQEPDRPASSEPAPAGSGAMTTEEVRRRWPEVLETLSAARVTWSLVGQNAQVASLDAGVLRLAFRADGLARAFANPRHTSAVEEAVYQTLGIQVRVEGIVGEGPGSAGGSDPSGGGPGGSTGPAGGPGSGSGGTGGGPGSDSGPSGRAGQRRTTGPRASTGAEHNGQGSRGSVADAASSAATGMPADSDGWPEVPIPGVQASEDTNVPSSTGGSGVTEDASAADIPGSTGGGNGGGGTGPETVDVWDTTAVQARTASGAPGAVGGLSANDGSGEGGSTAVAVAERTAPVSAPAPPPHPSPGASPDPTSTPDGARPTRGRAATASAAPPDDEPIPEPPPGYDDDLERSGVGGATSPPVPESVYATQEPPSRLTGAERAREALRRAQAARNPVTGGAAGPAAQETSATPGAGGASYEELSADDPDLETGGNGLVGVPLVVKVLGGTVIDEKVDQA
ncbi:DNA polymerase III subunit gamma and tau [Myceligenerans pegani]|uniref:DNA-directed DNA polymerase n=1 Tax=Myceligenerans pegani TaxID=2776917 RepID=A0ABR9MUM5_9MICO|nr:DNA polymerase III subunit gamma and tau [Myceligenerans sp. TRM 65318]MBE1875073.1 DNA polymerase III subunit gamma and tau [Myceligenerans sp. TRM 65318]MBE3017344.1 DNA polymerase III subunit gamma and tau [Myceligenerans sp. TRM 65318]